MSDLLSAISILLVFLTFLLNVVDRDISASLKIPTPPPAKRHDIIELISKLKSLLFKAILISIVYLITGYALLPMTIELMQEGTISLWNFTPLSTIFIFIQIAVIGLFIYAVYKTIGVDNRIKELKRLIS